MYYKCFIDFGGGFTRAPGQLPGLAITGLMAIWSRHLSLYSDRKLRISAPKENKPLEEFTDSCPFTSLTKPPPA